MNNDRAKELVDKELKKTKYVSEWENDINNVLSYTSAITIFGLTGALFGSALTANTNLSEINGILVGVASSLPLSIGIVHISNYAFHSNNEKKLEMKRDHYSKKVLLSYKRQLKKGYNPLEETPDNYDVFQYKVNEDTEKRYAKQLQLK